MIKFPYICKAVSFCPFFGMKFCCIQDWIKILRVVLFIFVQVWNDSKFVEITLTPYAFDRITIALTRTHIAILPNSPSTKGVLKFWSARTYKHFRFLIRASFCRHVIWEKLSGKFPRISYISRRRRRRWFNFGSVPTQSIQRFKCTGFRVPQVSTLLIMILQSPSCISSEMSTIGLF